MLPVRLRRWDSAYVLNRNSSLVPRSCFPEAPCYPLPPQDVRWTQTNAIHWLEAHFYPSGNKMCTPPLLIHAGDRLIITLKLTQWAHRWPGCSCGGAGMRVQLISSTVLCCQHYCTNVLSTPPPQPW